MWRFRVGSFAVALLLASAVACGARARGDGSSDAPSVSAGTGGANAADAAGSRTDTSAGGLTPSTGGVGAAVAGSAAGAAGAAGAAEADSDLSNSCPQAPSNRSCPAIEIDIPFTRDAVGPREAVWVEPLQIPIPDYRQEFPADPPEIEPSKWDRSPLPAGACVLRIHGLSGACLQHGPLYVGTCASLTDPDVQHLIPVGYYESNSCREGIAPGCPSATASDWRNGNWWYLVARGEDTDLVVCAPLCGAWFGLDTHACLRMAGSG